MLRLKKKKMLSNTFLFQQLLLLILPAPKVRQILGGSLSYFLLRRSGFSSPVVSGNGIGGTREIVQVIYRRISNN